ncbi:Tyrosine recombinase XerD [subsurface metagenome]
MPPNVNRNGKGGHMHNYSNLEVQGLKRRKEKTKENLLTDTEVDRLIEACQGFKDRFMVSMLLYTGMRVSEFIHMRRGWIDWEMGLIRTPEIQRCGCRECGRELKNRRGQITKPPGVWKPKTFEAVRAIPIVPEVKGVLKEFFSKHEEVMELIPSRGAAYYRFKGIAGRAGIEHPVFPHVARGTFATLLARKGFNAFELMSTMGWKSIKTAEDYIKLSGSAVKQAFKEKW